MISYVLRRTITPSLKLIKCMGVPYKTRNVVSGNCLQHVSVVNSTTIHRQYSEQTKVEEIIVDYDYVKAATSNRNVLIVDVREPEEIKEHGKIPNSVNIPLGSIGSAFCTMSEKEFEETYKRSKPNEDSEVIFYCMIGKRSGMAQQNALNFGYKNVKNYLGSWTDWSNKNKK